jgi:hypothetical protein
VTATHQHQFEADHITRITERGIRWYIGHTDTDYQTGDLLVLWPQAAGDGHGLAHRIEHVAHAQHEDTGRTFTVLTLSEPLEARTQEEPDAH